MYRQKFDIFPFKIFFLAIENIYVWLIIHVDHHHFGCITKLTERKQKNTLHVIMCKYYSSYMVIIYAPSSKQARSTWRMMMYLNRDMDGGPFLVYFINKNFHWP